MISSFVVIMVSIIVGMALERCIRHWKSGWVIVGPNLGQPYAVDVKMTHKWSDVVMFKLSHTSYIVVKVYGGDDYAQSGLK